MRCFSRNRVNGSFFRFDTSLSRSDDLWVIEKRIEFSFSIGIFERNTIRHSTSLRKPHEPTIIANYSHTRTFPELLSRPRARFLPFACRIVINSKHHATMHTGSEISSYLSGNERNFLFAQFPEILLSRDTRIFLWNPRFKEKLFYHAQYFPYSPAYSFI